MAKATHIKNHKKSLCENPKVEVLNSSIKTEENQIYYVCGKFNKDYNFIHINNAPYSKGEYNLEISRRETCMFCNNLNSSMGSYYAICSLYKKEIYKASMLWHNRDYALCCNECISNNIEEKEIYDDSKIFPIYIRNDLDSNESYSELEKLSVKSNREDVEKEINKIFKELYGEDSFKELEKCKGKEFTCISQNIEVKVFKNRDYLVRRLYTEYPNITSSINIDDSIEEVINS